MATRPSRSPSRASLTCTASATGPERSGRAQGFAQELDERRARAVSDVEAQPLVAALGRGEQRAARQQDRVIARAAREPIDRHGIGHAAPQEDAFTRSAVELDAGGLEPGAGI